MLLCASLQQCSAFLSPGHKHVLQISVPAADLSPVAPSPPCRSPPALVAAPAVWPSAASAYPSPCLRQQNQLVSDRKAKTCFLNSWALFFYFLLSLTTKQSPPLTPGASDQVERWQRCLFLCFAVQGKWKVKSEVFGCLLTTFSRRGLINTTNPFFFFLPALKIQMKTNNNGPCDVFFCYFICMYLHSAWCILFPNDSLCFLHWANRTRSAAAIVSTGQNPTEWKPSNVISSNVLDPHIVTEAVNYGQSISMLCGKFSVSKGWVGVLFSRIGFFLPLRHFLFDWQAAELSSFSRTYLR